MAITIHSGASGSGSGDRVEGPHGRSPSPAFRLWHSRPASCSGPRVDDLPHLSCLEVVHVPRDHRHPVHDGGGRDQRIPFDSRVRHTESRAPQGHGRVDGQRALHELGAARAGPSRSAAAPPARRRAVRCAGCLSPTPSGYFSAEISKLAASRPETHAAIRTSALPPSSLRNSAITFVSSRNIRKDRAERLRCVRPGDRSRYPARPGMYSASAKLGYWRPRAFGSPRC